MRGANDLHFIAARICSSAEQKLWAHGFKTRITPLKPTSFAETVQLSLDIPNFKEADYDIAFLKVIEPLTILLVNTIESRNFRFLDELDSGFGVVCKSPRLSFRIFRSTSGSWFWKKHHIHLEFIGRK